MVFLGLAGVEGSFHGAKFVWNEVFWWREVCAEWSFLVEGSFVFDETGFDMT